MGNVENITADKFPQQGTFLHHRVSVCFHYDTSRQIMGTIVRDDREEPFELLIKLDDGRYVLGGECQYSPVPEPGDLERLQQEIKHHG